jgi:hypothetical protein
VWNRDCSKVVADGKKFLNCLKTNISGWRTWKCMCVFVYISLSLAPPPTPFNYQTQLLWWREFCQCCLPCGLP